MAVPNIFATATSAIPLSQLDQNFATAITLGNTALYLGNTTTTVAGLTLTSPVISSITNTGTLTLPTTTGTLSLAGANSDITSMTAVTAINRTGGTALTGTNTNDAAAAGRVGEYISSTVASANAVSLTNATTSNITSISLTAGDWDVSGEVGFTGNAATSQTYQLGSISQTSLSIDQAGGMCVGASPRADTTYQTSINRMAVIGGRISLSATTTVYLTAQAGFSVSTLSAYGFIRARRVR